MSAQSIIDNIASTIEIEASGAERVAGIIFSVLLHEAPDLAAQLFSKIPGADELASANDVLAPQELAKEGFLGMISGMVNRVVGEKAGALVGGLAALKASGLTADQIRQAGLQVISHAQNEDPDLVKELISHIPGLKGHFGLT